MNHPLTAPARNARRPMTAAVLGLLLAAGQLSAGKNDPIVMSSTAAPDYVRATDEKGKPAPETYVFMEGKYLGAGTADKSADQMTFAEITQALVGNLAKQNYFPTKDVPSAKLLIRVFWGATLIYEDPQRDQNIAAINSALANAQAAVEGGSLVDVGELKSALAQGDVAAGGVEGALARNAMLLGYKRSLDKEGRAIVASVEEQTMRVELAEERYFVVLMAYDYQHMKREKKPKLAWVTRLSIRGPGNNFIESLPALALAGSEVFGRNLDGLERVKVRDLPGGEVILGDLQVIGVAETTKEAKEKK